jgi:hypothetical protein
MVIIFFNGDFLIFLLVVVLALFDGAEAGEGAIFIQLFGSLELEITFLNFEGR